MLRSALILLKRNYRILLHLRNFFIRKSNKFSWWLLPPWWKLKWIFIREAVLRRRFNWLLNLFHF